MEEQDENDREVVFHKIWERQDCGQKPWSVEDDDKDEEERWLGPKIGMGMFQGRSPLIRELEKRMFFGFNNNLTLNVERIRC